MENQPTQNQDVQNKDGFYITANLVDTLPQTAANYGMFFTARHPCEVLRVTATWGVAATGGGSGALQVEKLTGTTAKGSGINTLLTAIDMTATANTPVIREGKTLVTATSARQLKENERLAIKSSGTITALKDLQVTLYLKFLGRGEYK